MNCGNEITEVVKDECEKRLLKTKKGKKVNWITEQMVDIEKRDKSQGGKKFSGRNLTKFQNVRRDKNQYYNNIYKGIEDGNRYREARKSCKRSLNLEGCPNLEIVY